MQAISSIPAVKRGTHTQYASKTLPIHHATGVPCVIAGEADLPALQVQGPNIIMHLLHVLLAFPPCCVAAHHVKGVVVHSYLATSSGGGCCSVWGASAGPLVLLCVILPHIIEVPAHAADQLRPVRTWWLHMTDEPNGQSVSERQPQL